MANGPMTQRGLAGPIAQLVFHVPTRPNDLVDPVDPSQL